MAVARRVQSGQVVGGLVLAAASAFAGAGLSHTFYTGWAIRLLLGTIALLVAVRGARTD